jgi:hypothetical protein
MGRLLQILAGAVIFNAVVSGSAFAGFFGFGSDDKGKSGLDFNRGYDVNTVATVSGRVVSLPRAGGSEQYLIGIRSGSENVNVSVGPASYWEKKGIPVRINDEISARGAKAQGEDGKTYLLTQKLVNRSTGAQLELRSESGKPAWSGANGAGMSEQRSSGMSSGMRSSFGGMHGGFGMMRH